MGQKILSFFEPKELVQALLTKDSKTFSKISGVGPKLANRLVTELKDTPKKMGFSDNAIIDDQISAELSGSKIADDAISALENLGYKKYDCQKIINSLLKENSDITLENLITQSLRRLSK